jgi:hypothetical protein
MESCSEMASEELWFLFRKWWNPEGICSGIKSKMIEFRTKMGNPKSKSQKWKKVKNVRRKISKIVQKMAKP